MIEAVSAADLSCIMDQSRDRAIQEQLIEIGEGAVCWDLPADLQLQADKMTAQRLIDRSPTSTLRQRLAWFWRSLTN